MELIDTHCHLARFYHDGSLDAVLARMPETGVAGAITVGTSRTDWPLYRELAAHHPGRIWWTAGLHPSDVDVDWPAQLADLADYLEAEPRPVAVGEVGLDFFRLPKDPVAAATIVERQRLAFRQQLALAKERDLPVVVHSRGAFQACVDEIDASGVDWERVVFHCFVDGAEEIAAINQRGGVGSFTGIATYENGETVRQAIAAQGLERLMVETDAPYLTPEPHRGKTNEPALVVHTAGRCAEVLGVPLATLAEHSTRAARRFFRLEIR